MNEQKLREQLKLIVEPFEKKGFASIDFETGVTLPSSGKVNVIIEVNTEYMKEGAKLKKIVQDTLKDFPDLDELQIALTAQRKPKAHNPSKQRISGVKRIIAVGSGKGGVGKSTTAVNLACAFLKMNLKVGILDGDIFGPSLPRLLGAKGKPTTDDNKMINPIEAKGMKCMSMGFMMDDNMPAIWRGSMVQTAFRQMLLQVKWGELDVLVIDLPPGTGDVQLTMVQNVVVDGAIIVSTPQDLALVDARRGLEMFNKVSVPVIGLVENMSYFICPYCTARSDVFEHGGVAKAAKELGLPLLGEIPLQNVIRETSEKGAPIVLEDEASEAASIYKSISNISWREVSKN